MTPVYRTNDEVKMYFKQCVLMLFIAFIILGCDRQEKINKQFGKADSEYARENQVVEKFDPDREYEVVSFDKVYQKNGPLVRIERQYRLGAVMKFLGNPYWQEVAKGMKQRADDFSIMIDIQAAPSESSPENQLRLMEIMISKGYDAILISPQTSKNLMPTIIQARSKGILVVDIDDAVLDDVEYFVGSNNYQMGIHAAEFFIHRYPEGGKVALLKGLDGTFTAMQRSKGFIDRLNGTSFNIIAQHNCDWDLQKAIDASLNILQNNPDLKGFYCNNDVMALGASEAVKRLSMENKIEIIGTDGIKAAYDAIKNGELAATIDSFPYNTGLIAVDIALRILEGQQIPKMVFTPHQLITIKNVENQLPGFPLFTSTIKTEILVVNVQSRKIDADLKSSGFI
jgi:ribose transport system substrate-binding protein